MSNRQRSWDDRPLSRAKPHFRYVLAILRAPRPAHIQTDVERRGLLFEPIHDFGKLASVKRRLGNTSSLGQSGTGKTVLLGHLISKARKFGYTAAIFDKDRGLQVTVMAMGGKYFPMQMGVRTGWNYLQLESTKTNVSFMSSFTKQLGSNGSEAVTMTDQMQIEKAVAKLVEFIDRPQRRLSTLLQFLPAAPSEGSSLSLRERLERWCVGHENGWMFDNDTDELDLTTTDLFGFDLTEYLDKGEIRDAAVTFLLYRTQQMIDGRRFAYFFDEAHGVIHFQTQAEVLRQAHTELRCGRLILRVAFGGQAKAHRAFKQRAHRTAPLRRRCGQRLP